MGQIKGARVCGYRDGDAFKDVTRPGSDGKCPTGTAPCNPKSSLENTVCYPPSDLDSVCPITYIDIVTASKGHKDDDYESVSFTGDKQIIFSKSVDSLPITTIRLENEPCAEGWKTSDGSGTIPLPNEVQ